MQGRGHINWARRKEASGDHNEDQHIFPKGVMIYHRFIVIVVVVIVVVAVVTLGL